MHVTAIYHDVHKNSIRIKEGWEKQELYIETRDSAICLGVTFESVVRL